MLNQTHDFAEEVQVLATLLRQMDGAQWSQPTQFKQWTPDQILRHLHCWDEAADWAVHAPQAFQERLDNSRDHVRRGRGMREFEQEMVNCSGPALQPCRSDLISGDAYPRRAPAPSCGSGPPDCR